MTLLYTVYLIFVHLISTNMKICLTLYLILYNSRPDFIYNNLFALNHKSCIDHFIVSMNVYDNIHLDHVICDPTNLSNHNSIELVIDHFKHLLT